MGRNQKDNQRIDCKVGKEHHDSLAPKLVSWGYKVSRQGVLVPWWGEFIKAIALGVIADDGENIVIKIPYRKG